MSNDDMRTHWDKAQEIMNSSEFFRNRPSGDAPEDDRVHKDSGVPDYSKYYNEGE